MKVAFVILAIAVFGVMAEGPAPFTCTGNALVCKFKEIGHHIKYHASKLGNSLKDVGTSVLSSALDQGKDLLASASQAVLGTVMDHMSKEGLVGKRDISGFVGKVKEHLANGATLMKEAKDGLHKAFKAAVDKMTTHLSNLTGLKQIEDDADKQIDGVVDEFNKEGKKGFFSMAKTIADKVRQVFAAGMSQIREMFGKKVEERAILGFDSVADAWAKAKASLSGLAGGVADTFRPHLDNLKQGLATLGDKVKGHASNLADAAKTSFNALKDKLAGHVETLKGHAATLGGHATNAVNALKEAISNIAMQAISNAKDTLGDAAATGTDAAQAVADHVSGAVADAVSGY